MKIRHEDWGEVDKVEPLEDTGRGYCWRRIYRGCVETYYHGQGWCEVKEPKYVDVTGELAVLEYKTGRGVINGISERGLGINGMSLYLPEGYLFKKKHWFDLPNNLVHEIHYMTAKGFIEYIQRFKKPCLIVEKEE